MDNISGSANWTVYDVPPKKEKIIDEQVEIERIPLIIPDISPLNAFIDECKMKYAVTPAKILGDAIVHLDIATSLIKTL